MWLRFRKRSVGEQWRKEARHGFQNSQIRVCYTESVYIIHAISCECNYAGKSTKTHLYWCMKHANGDAEVLRESILNISRHYQVVFTLLC